MDVVATAEWNVALSLMSEDASLNNTPPGAGFDTPVHWQLAALKRKFRARPWSPSKDDHTPR